MSDLRFEQAFIEHGWDERHREIRWQTWQAAILAERERLAKAQDKRAAELDDDADFYHRKGDAHEAIERRVRARERKFVADAIRRGEGV